MSLMMARLRATGMAGEASTLRKSDEDCNDVVEGAQLLDRLRRLDAGIRRKDHIRKGVRVAIDDC